MSRYSATDLARLTGVTERTVRFYIQEGLLARPSGRGPGAHFTDRHLFQLRRVRLLQAAGLELAAIRQHGEDIEATLAERGTSIEQAEMGWAAITAQAAAVYAKLTADAPPPVVQAISRIDVAPGISILVDSNHRLPPPDRLAEVARVVKAAFGAAKARKPRHRDG